MLTFERGISGEIGYQGVGECTELSSKSPLRPRLVRIQPCSHYGPGRVMRGMCGAQKVIDAAPLEPEASLKLMHSFDVISARAQPRSDNGFATVMHGPYVPLRTRRVHTITDHASP